MISVQRRDLHRMGDRPSVQALASKQVATITLGRGEGPAFDDLLAYFGLKRRRGRRQSHPPTRCDVGVARLPHAYVR